jgi:hypothetical protein
VFNRVKELSLKYGASIPHQAISEGFLSNDEKILLDNRAIGFFEPTIVTVILYQLVVIYDLIVFWHSKSFYPLETRYSTIYFSAF